MNLSDRLRSVRLLFLDTAPVVYYVEENERYLSRVDWIFDRLDRDEFSAVASPITLAECLVVPHRDQRTRLRQAFTDLLTANDRVTFTLIDQFVADKAAELRARYNLALPDALQAAAALDAGCDAFFTNDSGLKRVTELNVIVLDEVEAE